MPTLVPQVLSSYFCIKRHPRLALSPLGKDWDLVSWRNQDRVEAPWDSRESWEQKNLFQRSAVCDMVIENLKPVGVQLRDHLNQSNE